MIVLYQAIYVSFYLDILYHYLYISGIFFHNAQVQHNQYHIKYAYRLNCFIVENVLLCGIECILQHFSICTRRTSCIVISRRRTFSWQRVKLLKLEILE